MSKNPHKPGDHKFSRRVAKAALRRSGYLLEQRIEARLRENGFLVETNLYLPDRSSGKPREFDLVAFSGVPIGEGENDPPLNVMLAIECVNNRYPMALFARQRTEGTLDGQTKVSGYPQTVYLGEKPREPVATSLQLPKLCRFAGVKFFATQYCSFTLKKNNSDPDGFPWMATHPDDYYASISKLADAVELFDLRTRNLQKTDDRSMSLWLIYPIMVLQRKMWSVHANGKSIELQDQPSFFLQATGLNENSERLLIDVCTESAFPTVCNAIMREASTIAAAILPHLDKYKECASEEKDRKTREAIVEYARSRVGESFDRH